MTGLTYTCNMCKSICVLVALVSVLLHNTASAKQDKLKVSGFGTLATATADTSTYQFRTDRSQAALAKKDGFAFKPLSLLGLQVDYRFTDRLDFVGQFVYREQDRQNIDSVTQMAFLRYKITPSWQLRAGRVAADIFHFSDTRDVSIAYPWVKVPTEVYGIVPARSFDGTDVSYLKPFENFNLSIKGFWGQGESDFTSNAYRPITFKNLSTIGVELVSFDWSVSLKHTQTEANDDSPDAAFIAPAVAQLQPLWSGASAFADKVTLRGADIHYTSFYFNRLWHDWEFSGEVAHIDSNSIALRHSINGFLNASYFYGAHTFYAMYSFANADAYFLAQEEPGFPINAATAELALFVDEVANSLAHNQQTVSVGWRWDLKENLAFKVQLERTDIEARGGGLRARDGLIATSEDGTAHTLFFALSFSF